MAHCQQTVGGNTFVGHDTEQFARRQAGVFHEPFEIPACGKTLARFPHADGADGNTQITGDFFHGQILLVPPVAKGVGKTGANVTL